MLWRTSEITGYDIQATDDSIGEVHDLLVDDETWAVRWLVVDTGSWLPGRKVLLPPSCLGRPNAEARRFPVELTRKKVEESPGLDADKPVSRQAETDIYDYYGWAPYWTAGYWPGAAAIPPAGAAPPEIEQVRRADAPKGDPHLRSVKEVTGYHIRATDDEIGHVEEFLVEDGSWAVRYMVVDTRNWWPGKKVLVSPQWIRDVSWPDRKVYVDVNRQAVKDSPEYDPAAPVDRAYEERLHRHYDQPIYWV